MYETKPKSSAGPSRHTFRAVVRFLRRWRRRLPLEALFWSVGLGAMAAMDPAGTHVISLCPLDALGLSFCPGCGLGHAVAHLARGELAASLRAHPLGLPAVLILGAHVGRLLRAHPFLGSRTLSS